MIGGLIALAGIAGMFAAAAGGSNSNKSKSTERNQQSNLKHTSLNTMGSPDDPGLRANPDDLPQFETVTDTFTGHVVRRPVNNVGRYPLYYEKKLD